MNPPSLEHDPLDALAEGFVERLRQGERPALTEYTENHPELAERIRKLFPALVLLEELSSVGGASPAAGSGLLPGAATVPRELGEYRILREVGRGGMGIVYEALQQSLGRHVALKVLPYHALLRPTHIERFRREARAAAQLHHTNIVPVFGVGEHGGLHYYAMQYIHGQGLDEVLQEVKRLRSGVRSTSGSPRTMLAEGMLSGLFSSPSTQSLIKLEPSQVVSSLPATPATPFEDLGRATHPATPSEDSGRAPQQSGSAIELEAGSANREAQGRGSDSHSDLTSQPDAQYFRSVAQLAVQVAEALDYAHRQGILHRDIKPSNLLLDNTGRVWITDFGLAKVDENDELTHTGDLVGTLRYMAPERLEGKADPRSDVYGLGVTLYEMLTLAPPFEDASRAHLMERILRQEPPRLRKLEPHIPRDLETIVLKAMAKEPGLRYGTAGALAEDLRRFVGDRPIKARRTSPIEHIWRWCRRNPLVVSLLTAIVLLLAGLTGGSLIQNAWLSQSLQAERAKRWESLRDRARALRMSRHPGQRIESLRSIAEALQLPLPPGHSLAELRTEAVAALALPDIEVVREWPGGLTPGILTVAFDANLAQYARFAEDGTITICRVSDDSVITRWKEDTARPLGGERFSRDGRYLSVWYGGPSQLVVRRLDGPESTVCYRSNECSSSVVDFTPDSTQLAYGLPDTRIAVVDLRSGRIRYLPPTGVQQDVIEFAPDGRQFAITVERDGNYAVEIRELASGKVLTSLPHPASANAFRGWHPDGWMIATVCGDRLIRLWDVRSGKLLRTLEGHKSDGIHCSFDTSGQALVSNDWDGVLRVWETSSGRQLLSFPAAGYPLVRVGPEGLLPATHIADPTKLQILRIYGSAEYRTIAVDLPANPRGFSFGVHPEGRLLLVRRGDTGDSTTTLALVDLATGQEVGDLPVHDGQPLLWEPSGALLTSCPWGLLRWPVQRDVVERDHYRFGPPERVLQGLPEFSFWDASADGQTILVPGPSGAVVVHRGPPERRVSLPPQREVRFFAISPDGRWVATGGHGVLDGFGARVWDAATGEPVKALPLPPFCMVRFSPDGRWLLTTSGGCRLWQVGTWAEGPRIGGTTGVFSPDGKLLAVTDPPAALRLVETATGAEVLRLETPELTPLRYLLFTPDGTRLIAVGTDTRALHVWDLRSLRARLVQLGLGWDGAIDEGPGARAAISLPSSGSPRSPLTVSVDLGDLSWAVPGQREEPRACNNQAWVLARMPQGQLRNPERIVQLAQKGVDLAPKEGFFWNTLGLAHYRAGNWKKAIEALMRSEELSHDQSAGWNMLFLAMAHWRIGEKEKSRHWYLQAVQWMDRHEPKNEELRLFRAEAAELLGLAERPR